MGFKKIESSFILNGIPAIHANSHLHNFENKYEKQHGFYKILIDTADLLLKTPSKFPQFVFLCGTPGNGKSHYLIGLYRALVHQIGYAQGDGASYYPFTGLAQEIIAGFKDNIPIRTAMSAYTQPKYMFLDDFTASERIMKVDSLEFTVFRDIILDRYDKGHHLIASSNFGSIELLSEIDKLFGSYVTSRLANSKIIQFPNIDLRRMGK